MALTLVGVRHHSPACARLVRERILAERPRHVLIEGPSDFNGRLGELRLGHQPPLALFAYHHAGGVHRAAWYPFCSHSPEWVAVHTAAETGAEAHFIDLPTWHPALHDLRNRYSDRHERPSRVVARLCRRFGVSDLDALWDHLFEQPLEPAELTPRLEAYFAEVRGDDPAGPGDDAREECMARWIAWALADCRTRGGHVLVVCGGYHAPALARLWARVDPSRPPLSTPDPQARAGAFLVPYSFRRLDSFTGYDAGMPSPAFQEAVWAVGHAAAAEQMTAATVARLRGRKQAVSAADLVAASAMAEGLRRLRGHAATSRVDLLDGLAAALVKDALDVPLPWTYRGTLRPRTEPVLVEVMEAFRGDRVGRLSPRTPRPPLLHDVQAVLEAHDLVPVRNGREVPLDLAEPADLGRSRVLHRLRVLHIPGFERLQGPAWATEGPAAERWRLEARYEAQAALIEAGAYGATLEAAAGARLEEELLEAGGRLAELSRLLLEAVFVGLDTLTRGLLDEVAQQAAREGSLAELGAALARLLGVFRHDTLLGAAGHQSLGRVIVAAFDRGLWLVEGVSGGGPADPALVGAVLALRDTLRQATALPLSRQAAHDVMARRAHDAAAPPALRGAALGFLWSTGFFADASGAAGAAVAAVRRSARPAILGDFLAGLFALAREEAYRAPGLVQAVDAALTGLPGHEFLVALPALRLAFSYFPPAEKEALAGLVLRLREARDEDPRILLTPTVPALAEAMSLERQVDEVARRYGLG